MVALVLTEKLFDTGIVCADVAIIFSGIGIAIWNLASLLIVYQATYVRASLFNAIISDFSCNARSYHYAKLGKRRPGCTIDA